MSRGVCHQALHQNKPGINAGARPATVWWAFNRGACHGG